MSSGDEDEQRRRAEAAPPPPNQIEQPLLDDLEARQRPARQLQAGERAERGELDLVELVQDLLGAEVDLDRKRKEGFGAAFDGFGRRPGQQQEDGVGLEAADAGDRLGEVAIEHRFAHFRRRAVAATGVRKRQPTTLMPSAHGS
jgi:hypothetical protein